MNVLRFITDFIKMSKVWFLSMEFYGVWQEVATRHRTPYLDIFIKSVISLKTFILQIWVTWASKISVKNFQFCSIKIKGSHAPCDVNASALYLPYLRRVVVTSQIICDVTDVHYDAKKESAS